MKGYEIEHELVEISKKYFNGFVEEKDIFKLTKTIIKKYQAIYFWEPFEDNILCQKFIKFLEKKCSKGQIIIYYCSGHIKNYLDNSKQFKKLNNQYKYNIYIKL